MSINIKNPKYVIPVIILPFLCIFFYVYKSGPGKPKRIVSGKDSLQTGIADVSDQVKAKTLSDKLDAFRERYKQSDGYTAIGEIRDDQVIKDGPPTPYNDKEKHMLDSIENALSRKYGKTDQGYKSISGGFPDVSTTISRPKNYDQQDQALAMALAKMNQPRRDGADPQKTDPTPDAMQLFRQQMALVDSIGKAADPDYKAELKRKKQEADAQKEITNRNLLPVSKASRASSVFNTITADRDDSMLTAMVDQDITGYLGSRLRIRLLENMMAGKFLIKEGTYLYAQISGFTGQRVNLSISSIMQGGHILPVKLDVFDNDGLPGLYVPASAFREFTKELGTDATGITLQQQAENNSQLVMSLLQKMFQSTTTAVSKLIRQNKANLKYNTLVYLIDPAQLRNNQHD